MGFRRQNGLDTIECDSDPRAESGLPLEDNAHLPALLEHAADPRRPFGGDVAELDAARGIDRDRVVVLGVLGLMAKLDWLAGAADV
jgi:hypothetical protein